MIDHLMRLPYIGYWLPVAVAVVATAGAYREAGQSRESNEPLANEFAIADSAIQDEFLQ